MRVIIQAASFTRYSPSSVEHSNSRDSNFRHINGDGFICHRGRFFHMLLRCVVFYTTLNVVQLVKIRRIFCIGQAIPRVTQCSNLIIAPRPEITAQIINRFLLALKLFP
mmetsp:Transcript_12626/g.20093  ORF Transcript_12626/g.20093 Transcript_12626/m.20093 type:complete len:109 (-) Transcript_12626:142-468(-)